MPTEIGLRMLDPLLLLMSSLWRRSEDHIKNRLDKLDEFDEIRHLAQSVEVTAFS